MYFKNCLQFTIKYIEVIRFEFTHFLYCFNVSQYKFQQYLLFIEIKTGNFKKIIKSMKKEKKKIFKCKSNIDEKAKCFYKCFMCNYQFIYVYYFVLLEETNKQTFSE